MCSFNWKTLCVENALFFILNVIFIFFCNFKQFFCVCFVCATEALYWWCAAMVRVPFLYDAAIRCTLAWRLNDLWMQSVGVSVHSPLRRAVQTRLQLLSNPPGLKCVCNPEETRASETGSGPKPSHRLGNPGWTGAAVGVRSLKRGFGGAGNCQLYSRMIKEAPGETQADIDGLFLCCVTNPTAS